MQYKLITISLIGVGLTTTTLAQKSTPPPQPLPSATHALQSTRFIENCGQWVDATVHFGFRTDRLSVAFRESSLAMYVDGPDGTSSDSLAVTFPGSNLVIPTGDQPQAARINYFVGGQGRTSQASVPSFGSVVYENLYDGIDLHIRDSYDGILKYEFHIAPGFDCTQIQINCDGVDDLCGTSDGGVLLETPLGTLMDHAPVVWQEINGSRYYLDARFETLGRHAYAIKLLQPVDAAHPVIIDPEVEWMTYLGGSDDYDQAFDIAVDASGNIFATGWTCSTDFEGRNNTHHGDIDAFIVKMNPAGSLEWMTYLGGSDRDMGYGIAVDPTGVVSVTGCTSSLDFEGGRNANHGGMDAFIVAVDAAGQLLSMNYLGGSDDDVGNDLVLDAAANALIAGETRSVDFEGRTNLLHGDFDAFVTKISLNESLQWMTYLGGSGADLGRSIAIDSVGHVMVTGDTESIDFVGRTNSHHGGACDVFVAMTDENGQPGWMNYLGGSDEDYGFGITIDAVGNAFMTGYTKSLDFEGRNNAFHGGSADTFLVRANALGTPVWMTYLGGSGTDFGNAIAADSAGNSYVTGYSTSTDFDGASNAYRGGWSDAIVLKVDAAANLRWMTYYGGTKADSGTGILLDGLGNAIIAGHTESTDFEGQNNAFHGFWDGLALRVNLVDAPLLDVTATCPTGGPMRIEWTQATPGGRAALLFALNRGTLIIPNNRPCAGTQIGLGANRIRIAWTGLSDFNGERMLNVTTGPDACGGYLQLVDLPTCSTSNVARIE